MSIQLIQQYHAQVEKIIRYGGSRKESSVRKPFQNLLEAYARQKNLEMIAELDFRTCKGHTTAEKFNTYRFVDYKEDVVDLVGRVTAVSATTMKFVEKMQNTESKDRI